jgi:cellulose synthase/poly-beta-1,6-N-acetylglucosamine synthase-like glycosyltransferase
MSVSPRRAPDFYTLAFLHVGCFALLYVSLWLPSLAHLQGIALGLWYLKAIVELGASFCLVSVFLKASDYLLSPDVHAEVDGPAATPGDPDRAWPSVACVYLCAGDLDRRALESLCRLEYPGRFEVHVHDDSGDHATAAEVDATALALGRSTGRRVVVHRRPVREGGKPGAVNHVLDSLPSDFNLILLADNDSTAVDARAVTKAVPLFDDARVAAVQFRNVGLPADGEGGVNRILHSAIDVFDLFARHQARHGMPLFFGHNAMLRREAVARVGGLRPGMFADDIDLSIRLVRAGYTIRYAPFIRFAETHPASYASFRKRAYKWAFGCGQVLRTHLLPALLDERLTWSQRTGLLEFVAFYSLQVVLVAYLALIGVVLPIVAGVPEIAPTALFLSGLVIVAAIFLPAFAYFARRRQVSRCWPFALVCAVVYGSVAFESAHGLFDGLMGRRRQWIPTNGPHARGAGGAPASVRIPTATWVEAAFGLLLFLVPALVAPRLLWQPSLYLFCIVFLFAPLTAWFYAPTHRRKAAVIASGTRFAGRRHWLAMFLAGLAVVPLLVSWHTQASPSPQGVVVRGDRIYVAGAPFLVKGVHYSPWAPGTGPMKHYDWPEAAVIDRDLAMIRGLGANTILVHDAPPSLLSSARRQGLMVIYAFFINWQSIGDDETMRARSDAIVHAAAGMAHEPNLLAFLLGNEVVEWVMKDRGAAVVEGRLRSLRDAVRVVAPAVPIGHENWPVTKNLDLSFMDFAAFNLYPSWPREVVIAGYGDYIETVLKPLAAGRPLLITEFGQNTLEASEARQARLLRDCWDEIRSRTAGGVVFSFADEWWKNYDNPVGADDFWRRQYAADDEATHDLDPEEYYGIVSSERAPKPAFQTVHDMFTGPVPAHSYQTLAFSSLPLLLLVGYTLFVFRRAAVS